MFEKDPRQKQTKVTSMIESAFYCAIIYGCLLVNGFIFAMLPGQLLEEYANTILIVTTLVQFGLFYTVRRGFEWFESLSSN